MAKKKQGLHKDVTAIFGDGSLPQEFVGRQPEVDKPTRKEGAKAAPKRRRRKTADSEASAAVAVAKLPMKKKRSSRRASPKKKLIQEQDAAADATEKISVDSAETGILDTLSGIAAEPPKKRKPSSRRTASKKKPREELDAAANATEKIAIDSAEAVILDPPPGIADETSKQEPTSVESQREEAPAEEVAPSQAVGESSVDVELPADTTAETVDESPAPTNEAKAEETWSCDQDESSAERRHRVLPKLKSFGTPKESESPPLGSIAFLEHLKKTLDWPKNFECCEDRFIDICKAKVSGKGKKVICLEGKHCGCRFQTKSFFRRVCTCDMRQHIAREYGY